MTTITPQAGDLLLMVGTMKGAFLVHSGPDRSEFTVSGPHITGASVYAMAYDGRAGRQRLYAGAQSFFFGTQLRHSDDFGATWAEPTEPLIAFPEDTEASLENIWQINLPADEPDVIQVGVEPAALFRSEDVGATFTLNRGLWDHPQRPRWEPGGGGLCMHTIVPTPGNPQETLVAVSAAGAYRTEDGGQSWAPSNEGIRVDFGPEKFPEFGQCVHKISRDAADPTRLFLQNHGGLYRSDDSGRSWNDIGEGVPSDFGFAMVTHPREANTAYCVPIDSAEWRCTPEGRMRVYRTTDGKSWEPLTEGLPQEDAHLTILRDGFCADSLDPAGLWFGTRTGQVYGSNDEGESWRLVADLLPPVVCVKAAVV